ncbi:hypothetical protein Hdeb2414_s0019g00548591 [Helianthus debilis subsp. tardiflorus]
MMSHSHMLINKMHCMATFKLKNRIRGTSLHRLSHRFSLFTLKIFELHFQLIMFGLHETWLEMCTNSPSDPAGQLHDNHVDNLRSNHLICRTTSSWTVYWIIFLQS